VADRVLTERRPAEPEGDDQRGEHREGHDGQRVRERAPPRLHGEHVQLPVGVIPAGAQHGEVDADEDGDGREHREGLRGAVDVLEDRVVVHALAAGEQLPARIADIEEAHREHRDLQQQFARLETGEGDHGRPAARVGLGHDRHGPGFGQRAHAVTPEAAAEVASRVSK
jgi:hypothetical protein